MLIPQFGVRSNALLSRPPLVYSTKNSEMFNVQDSIVNECSMIECINPLLDWAFIEHCPLTLDHWIRPFGGALPLDLHVLGTPPAFILSQDQTLQKRICLKLQVELVAPKSYTDLLKTIQMYPKVQNELTLICTIQFLTYWRFDDRFLWGSEGHSKKASRQIFLP